MSDNKQEKSAAKKKSSSFSTLVYFIKGSTRFFILAMLASFCVTCCEMVLPKIITVTVDNVIDQKAPESIYAAIISLFGGVEYLRSHLYVIAIFAICVGAVLAVCRFLSNYTLTYAGERLVKNIRDKLFHKVQRLSFSWYSDNHTGDIIQRMTTDISTIRSFIADQLISVFKIVLVTALSVYFMLGIDPLLTIIPLCFIPIMVTYSYIFNRNIKKSFQVCDENEGVLSAIVQENLTGVRVVRAFGKEAFERDKFDKQNTVYTSIWMKVCKSLALFWGSNDTMMGIETIAVLTFGTIICVRGDITAGNLLAFIAYNSFIIWPIRQLGRVISNMSKAEVAITRLQYINDEPDEADKAETKSANLSGDIAFEHVSFSYDGENKVLDDVSIKVKGGSVLGILGGTASGKSTLVLLLNRLYPLKEGDGRITIDGVDINDMKAEELRRGIGMVLQEPFLYTRSIGDNIGITQKVYDENAVMEAAKTACLDDTARSFSQGYGTVVGERGVTLSGGQKQRAAIARMLVEKAPIMVLDDSLSAVDAETDLAIRQNLQKDFNGSTVIIIAHRITTIMNADKIAVLERGKLTQFGTHDELMKNEEGLYRRIYDMQMTLPKEVREELDNEKE